jgi:hypothetical protein
MYPSFVRSAAGVSQEIPGRRRPASSPLPVVFAVVLLAFALALLPGRAARAQDHLLFCNQPEKIRMPGAHADTMLTAGKTYTIFFHYRNVSGASGPLVVALNGSAGKKLTFTARKGFGDPRADPTLAGRQAMARFLSAPEKPFVGKKGSAHFTLGLGNRQVASGVMTFRADQDTRLRIYFRHNQWSVPGARVVSIESPRREVQIALSKEQKRQSFRIGVPEAGMSRHLDGTYGMVYAFKVDAPAGRKVRVSFSPRGGKSGLVGSVNGAMRQTPIVPAASWKVFSEAVVGKNGMTLTTSPFGGVFYPVEIVFQLI